MSSSAIQQCKAGQGGARELHKRRRGAEDLQSISRRVRASFPGESKFSSCRAWASVDSLVHIFASVERCRVIPVELDQSSEKRTCMPGVFTGTSRHCSRATATGS